MLHNPRTHLHNTLLQPSSVTTDMTTHFEAVLRTKVVKRYDFVTVV